MNADPRTLRSRGAHDTIAACATPPGTGGIAVIRVSGPAAIDATAATFSAGERLRAAASHTAHFGRILSGDGGTIDEAVVTLFRAPASYTGEDVAEISCHGGTVVSRAVLDRVLAQGVRHAQPGEFTRRAFLNGRLDLAQAEAVADLIHARSDAARLASIAQMQGRLSAVVAEMRERLVRCLSLLELNLDFAEEDVELVTRAQLRDELIAARTAIATALDRYAGGRLLREGFKVVLAGRPNAGKSSLFNALLGTRRAIVTDAPGTTRDFIEEMMTHDGTAFRFVDTAGLRGARDEAEQAGIEFSREQLAEADAVCWVIDAAESGGLGFAHEAAQALRASLHKGTPFLTLLNKIDQLGEASGALSEDPDVLRVSAQSGDGIPALLSRLCVHARTRLPAASGAEALVTNARHADCLRRAAAALNSATAALDDGAGEELVALDTRAAIAALGEITGDVTNDDVLHAVFARFCIGK